MRDGQVAYGTDPERDCGMLYGTKLFREAVNRTICDAQELDGEPWFLAYDGGYALQRHIWRGRRSNDLSQTSRWTWKLFEL